MNEKETELIRELNRLANNPLSQIIPSPDSIQFKDAAEVHYDTLDKLAHHIISLIELNHAITYEKQQDLTLANKDSPDDPMNDPILKAFISMMTGLGDGSFIPLTPENQNALLMYQRLNAQRDSMLKRFLEETVKLKFEYARKILEDSPQHRVGNSPEAAGVYHILIPQPDCRVAFSYLNIRSPRDMGIASTRFHASQFYADSELGMTRYPNELEKQLEGVATLYVLPSSEKVSIQDTVTFLQDRQFIKHVEIRPDDKIYGVGANFADMMGNPISNLAQLSHVYSKLNIRNFASDDHTKLNLLPNYIVPTKPGEFN